MTKKLSISLLIFIISITTLVTPINASDLSQIKDTQKTEKINELFIELNELLVTEKSREFLKSELQNDEMLRTELGNNSDLLDIVNIENTYNIDKRKIEIQLQKLGVEKLNPDNESDMEFLRNLNTGTETLNSLHTDNTLLNNSLPASPDLSHLAGAYSLYKTQSSTVIGGITYNYVYIRVVDDKGYNGLTLNQSFNAAPANISSNVLSSILNYTYSYVTSSLLSSHPVGAFVDFTIGGIIAGVGGYNTSTISSNNENIYRLYAGSVSQLQYYWVYNGSSWQFIGSEGHFSFKQEDIMKFNSQGALKTVINNRPVWSSTSGHWGAYQHVLAYHNSNKSLSYSKSYPFGSFRITGYNNFNVTFSPIYRTLPGQLY